MDYVCWRAVCQSEWRRAGNGFAEVPLHHEVVCLFCFAPLHLTDPRLHAQLLGSATPSVAPPRRARRKRPAAVRRRRLSKRAG